MCALPARGEALRHGLEEEVEGVERGQLGDHLDLDAEPARRGPEHGAGQVVAVGVLLPVEEVVGRVDAERGSR